MEDNRYLFYLANCPREASLKRQYLNHMNFPEACNLACMGHTRKLHILLLLLRMLQVSSNTGTHMQHECCLVCNVFQSVANMVPATEEPQRISVVAELFLLWWAYWTHSAEGLPTFNHCGRTVLLP